MAISSICRVAPLHPLPSGIHQTPFVHLRLQHHVHSCSVNKKEKVMRIRAIIFVLFVEVKKFANQNLDPPEK